MITYPNASEQKYYQEGPQTAKDLEGPTTFELRNHVLDHFPTPSYLLNTVRRAQKSNQEASAVTYPREVH